MNRKKNSGIEVAIIFGTIINLFNCKAVSKESYISFEATKGKFAIAESGKPIPIYASSIDFPGVLRAAIDLQSDIEKVTNSKPSFTLDEITPSRSIILIGSLQKSPLINNLIKNKKLDTTNLSGRWEAFLIQIVKNPVPGVEQALVITGSDKRGTIYGIYDLSEQIGVSPWYWWADVPVRHHDNITFIPDRYLSEGPAVKYRGIFINDEKPCLIGWAQEKFGDLNHKFYENVFELILRMKGNYLWPAMWDNAFNDDDSLNEKLADEYGVVMGTSHHEPMMRAQLEWKHYGKGPWNYETNDSVLREFWRNGIRRMDNYESIITIGMRGDGDMPMSDESNIVLLEKIVKDQRNIIKEVTGKDPSAYPQIWALYKEVQDYYDKGMRVPDDVTLLLCDDNWGNIRKLPNLGEKKRKGGYGIYYHFDYVGDPRNYKWLNTNQIERVWEQMHLAYEYNARQIWIVNVGDIKPMEFPLQFFMDYAWKPENWPADKLPQYYESWTEEQFGEKYSSEIAGILSRYTKYNSLRKPELLSSETYSLINYLEFETVVNDYKNLKKEADRIYNSLPAEYKDAYFELVLHPVEACSNLNELYYFTGKNQMYAKQGRALTNALADSVKKLFTRDSLISDYYNNKLANGKWHHMMDQTHIGYTYWQQPPVNTMPKVKTIVVPDKAEMAVAIEGSEAFWPKNTAKAVLPGFNRYQQQSHYIEIFNRGSKSYNYSVKSEKDYLKIQGQKGTIDKEERIWITVDWQKTPKGTELIPITIDGPDKTATVYADIDNTAEPSTDKVSGFMENNGYVSMEAEHFSKAMVSSEIKWLIISNLGRTGSGVTPIPVTSKSQEVTGNSPHLEYSIFYKDTGIAKVHAYFSPTLAFNANVGLKFGISFDDEKSQIVNINSDQSVHHWRIIVAGNINIITTQHRIKTPGKHILKYWMVDPGIVLQKIVIDTGGEKPSYLGPPESYYLK